MYTDEDLNRAVEESIFSSTDVIAFRQYVAQSKHTHLVDEENFRLIGGFNDIFVVIASALLLGSLAWLGFHLHPMVGPAAVAAGSWMLAEYFVIKRRMALPAILLLLSFLGGVFATPMSFSEQPGQFLFLLSGGLTAIAAFAHWRRFRVPITIAAATVAVCLSVLSAIVGLNQELLPWLNTMLLVTGLIVFAMAMVWDAKDRLRQTRSSDVAFWLHLVAAPLIVHPIFSSLGVLSGAASLDISIIVVALYVLLALVSIAVDRRAIMVSALIYVVYAFASLLQTYGMISYSFALTGVCIGASLLLLSAFWQTSREKIVQFVPTSLKHWLPEVQ